MIINSLVLTSSVAGESPSAEPELAGLASRKRGVCSVGALATSFSSIDMAMGTIVADRLPVRLSGNDVRGKRSKAKVLGKSPTRGAYAEKHVRRNRRSDTLAPSHARVHQYREHCIKACAVLIFYIYFLLFLSFLLPFFFFFLAYLFLRHSRDGKVGQINYLDRDHRSEIHRAGSAIQLQI